ncbi:MAG TPA: hypothetical protein VE177_03580, partial [Candidatus Binatus sp.]|nr:hypothetical protein [Candidatus Binatus sp.]
LPLQPTASHGPVISQLFQQPKPAATTSGHPAAVQKPVAAPIESKTDRKKIDDGDEGVDDLVAEEDNDPSEDSENGAMAKTGRAKDLDEDEDEETASSLDEDSD